MRPVRWGCSVWQRSGAPSVPRKVVGGLVLEGTEAKILSDVVAQFYAYLSGCMFNDPVGMAIYAELHYMMSSLMLGEWFE